MTAIPNATDADLEKQAEEMAAKALPASLPESVRLAKLPAVKQKILDRLKAQRSEQEKKPLAVIPKSSAPMGMNINTPCAPAPPPPAAPPPPPKEDAQELYKVVGVELCGDEAWFADSVVRRRLRESVEEAHKEQKILVASPADEVERICPSDGRVLGAGGVLRLGGAHLGGYGESDIAYAYRQLSRALHPDKNPELQKAPAAFHRLSEASDELRQGLNEQRQTLQQLLSSMGGQATPEMLARPQEALFAEACRMLIAICGGVGEGEVPPAASTRILVAFGRCSIFHTCLLPSLLSEWFDKSHLLQLYSTSTIRTVYDCAPKRYRAQFLCLLNRAVMAEAKRCHGCVRGGWSEIMQTYPELGIWREFREMLRVRVWDAVRDPPPLPKKSRSPSPSRKRSLSRRRSRDRRDRSRSHRRRGRGDVDRDRGGGSSTGDTQNKDKDALWDARWKSSDDTPGQVDAKKNKQNDRDSRLKCKEAIETNRHTEAKASRWARKWRVALATVLPSAHGGAAPMVDKELRKLGAALWKDVTKWAAGCDAQRGLSLFRADHQSAKTFGWDSKTDAPPLARGLELGAPPADWAFLPLADLLLVVGEGLVGTTVEGVFADSPAGYKRKTFAQCYKKLGAKRSDRRNGDAGSNTNPKSKWDQQ